MYIYIHIYTSTFAHLHDFGGVGDLGTSSNASQQRHCLPPRRPPAHATPHVRIWDSVGWLFLIRHATYAVQIRQPWRGKSPSLTRLTKPSRLRHLSTLGRPPKQRYSLLLRRTPAHPQIVFENFTM